MGNAAKAPANCFNCAHLRITHLVRRPYACHQFGFKSERLPALEVRRFSGLECQAFTPKLAAPSALENAPTDPRRDGRVA